MASLWPGLTDAHSLLDTMGIQSRLSPGSMSPFSAALPFLALTSYRSTPRTNRPSGRQVTGPPQHPLCQPGSSAPPTVGEENAVDSHSLGGLSLKRFTLNFVILSSSSFYFPKILNNDGAYAHEASQVNGERKSSEYFWKEVCSPKLEIINTWYF